MPRPRTEKENYLIRTSYTLLFKRNGIRGKGGRLGDTLSLVLAVRQAYVSEATYAFSTGGMVVLG